MRLINIIITVILFMGNAAFAEESPVEHNLGEGSITRMIKGNEVTIYDWQMLMGDGSKMNQQLHRRVFITKMRRRYHTGMRNLDRSKL